VDCRECGARLVSYVLGDLTEDMARACQAHLDRCANCRETVASFDNLISAIASEPETMPSAFESAALAAALAQFHVHRSAVAPALQEFSGFVLASVAAFAVVATVVALQSLGVVSVVSVVTAVGPAALALTVVAVIFISSFLPIAVTARRRPLNGMTFKG